jgi:hypothetical protein
LHVSQCMIFTLPYIVSYYLSVAGNRWHNHHWLILWIWGVPPPNDGSYWMYCITSSVHSYRRSISTAGDGGEVVSAGDGGVAVSFFTLQITCSRDLLRSGTSTVVFHSFTPVLHIFTMYVFTLPYIVSYYLSVAGNRWHNLGWLMFLGPGCRVYFAYWY